MVRLDPTIGLAGFALSGLFRLMVRSSRTMTWINGFGRPSPDPV
jgi:hypothetical protein